MARYEHAAEPPAFEPIIRDAECAEAVLRALIDADGLPLSASELATFSLTAYLGEHGEAAFVGAWTLESWIDAVDESITDLRRIACCEVTTEGGWVLESRPSQCRKNFELALTNGASANRMADTIARQKKERGRV